MKVQHKGICKRDKINTNVKKIMFQKCYVSIKVGKLINIDKFLKKHFILYWKQDESLVYYKKSVNSIAVGVTAGKVSEGVTRC